MVAVVDHGCSADHDRLYVRGPGRHHDLRPGLTIAVAASCSWLGRARLKRPQLSPLAVAVVDVDNLRDLNALRGHARDAGLRRIADELAAVLHLMIGSPAGAAMSSWRSAIARRRRWSRSWTASGARSRLIEAKLWATCSTSAWELLNSRRRSHLTRASRAPTWRFSQPRARGATTY